MKKLKVWAVAISIFLISAGAAWSADMKIAHANLQKALNESEAGVKAMESLKEQAKKLDDEVNAKMEELKKMKDEIDKKSGVWNKETREAKEQELKNRNMDYQKLFMQYNDDLNKKKQDAENQIIDDLRAIVEEIAKKKGYSYVIERSVGGLLWAQPELDLTDEVIQAYNKRVKKGK